MDFIMHSVPGGVYLMSTLQEMIQDFKRLANEKDYKNAENSVFQMLSILFPNSTVTKTSMTHNLGMDFLMDFDEQKIGVELKIHRKKIVLRDVATSLVSATTQNLDKLLIISNTPFSKQTRLVLNKFSPLEVQAYDIDELVNLSMFASGNEENVASDKDKPASSVPDAVKIAAKSILDCYVRELIKLLRKYREYTLPEIEWRDMERIVAEIFSGLGFNVELTPSGRDGGKDVVVYSEGKKYLIEIKHWKLPNRVGTDYMQHFLEVVVSEHGDGGLYLSTSGYRKNAFNRLKVITNKPVKFQSVPKLMTLVDTYESVQAGLWSKSISAAEIIFY